MRFGILLNACVILVWVITRLVSVPELFEPLRLPVEGLGAGATAAEVTLLVMLIKLRRDFSQNEKRRCLI
jgi:hypothetical protein